MKQLVILSGKGGTGKTSVAAAFAHLASDGSSLVNPVLADADVDAANLELVLRPRKIETHEFIGGSVAEIDQERCTSCGICEQVCRFDAISYVSNQQGFSGYFVDPVLCDGCAACVYQCPEEAIQMHPQRAGWWFYSDSRFGPLYHADLIPAQENSGKLVTLVKQQARLKALDEDRPLVLVDGPPGIGCPVISSMAGADLALIVTEPSAAGAHDMHRILGTTRHFRIPTLVVINKASLHPQGTQEIESACKEMGMEVIGHIPYDPTITEAMMNAQPVTAYAPEAPASQALTSIWRILIGKLNPTETS